MRCCISIQSGQRSVEVVLRSTVLAVPPWDKYHMVFPHCRCSWHLTTRRKPIDKAFLRCVRCSACWLTLDGRQSFRFCLLLASRLVSWCSSLSFSCCPVSRALVFVAWLLVALVTFRMTSRCPERGIRNARDGMLLSGAGRATKHCASRARPESLAAGTSIHTSQQLTVLMHFVGRDWSSQQLPGLQRGCG